jgi:LacI family transcriptional regulator
MASMTIEHIAELADVSRSTVSRVLNNHPSVRPEVRRRVLRVIEEQGYAPQAAARNLASRRTNVISLLIPRSAAVIFTDPFFPAVIQGISEGCGRRGYFLMLSMVTADLEHRFYQQILRGRHFDGVIMLSSDIDDPILPLLIRDQTPLVLIGRHPFFEVSSVDAENREGARLATTHLIGLGHRRIATITGPIQMAAALDRRDGYKQALLEAGLTVAPELIAEGDFSQESGYRAMAQILDLPAERRPTAVFAAGDTMALGALRAIQEAGLRVPSDIAVVGHDDLAHATLASPQLTTVRQPIFDMGLAAVELLIEGLERGADAPVSRQRLPVELVIRQSCGAAAAGTPNAKGGR